MALLTEAEIRDALTRLGARAHATEAAIELVAVGGAVMVLAFRARLSTHDVDAIITSPRPVDVVRGWARDVASELSWPEDWLNDGAKGFVGDDPPAGPVIFEAPGIVVRRATVEQMLATKLSALRDSQDRSDALRLLVELHGTKEDVWTCVEPFVTKGAELKACYAFDEIWSEVRGDD